MIPVEERTAENYPFRDRKGLKPFSLKVWLAGGPGQKPRKPMNPISEKRKSKPIAMNVPKHERKCELTPLLGGIGLWERFALPFEGSDLWDEIDRHHVWHQRHHDEAWNLVFAARPVHEWAETGEEGGQQAAIIVCMKRLADRGDFRPLLVKELIGHDPLGRLENWLGESWLQHEPVLLRYAAFLFNGAGYPDLALKASAMLRTLV